MRKFTKLMLTFALLVGVMGGVNATKLYPTYGTPASNGSWDGTNTYSWTGSTNNLMTVFQFPNGELADYTLLHLNISTTGPRVCFMKGSSTLATIVFGSAGEKNIVLSQHESTKNLDLSQVTHISFGGNTGSGSVVLTNLYLQKPMSLRWADDGTAEIDLTDLTASGGFSLNDQTGVLTGTGESGSLKINFPTGGVDLSALTGFSVTYTGDNLFNNFEIGDGTTNKGFWSQVTGRDDLNQYMTVKDVGAPTAITNWKWNNNSTASTMTISSIKLKAGVIKANPSGEVSIETLERKYYEGGEWKTGKVTCSYGNNIDTPIGDGNATQDEYIDLSNYKEIRLYVSKGDVRIFVVKEESFTPTADGYILTKDGVKQNGQWNGIQDTEHKLVKNGDYYYITVTDLKAACGGQAKLIGVKAEYGQTVDVSKVVVIEDSEFNYSIFGSGPLSTSVTAALADANATSIDATGLTNTSAIALESANPNCLFKANAGKLSNTKNVIVDGTCANLVLTDGKPFKAPTAFTATNASFSKTVTAAGYATMVIPFGAALPTGVEAYNLTAVAGTAITSSSADAITADQPVMIKAAADDYEFTAAGAAIAATEEGVVTNGLLNGGYATMTAAAGANNYVLQKNGDDVNFYLVTGTDATVKPFRAYLTAPATARELTLNFGETTGISASLMNSDERIVKSEVYNLNGQRVAAPQKGLYIVNGKKVIVK